MKKSRQHWQKFIALTGSPGVQIMYWNLAQLKFHSNLKRVNLHYEESLSKVLWIKMEN